MTADSDNKLIMASQMCNSKLTAADIDAQLSVSHNMKVRKYFKQTRLCKVWLIGQVTL